MRRRPSQEPVRILVVEDNRGDVRLLSEVLRSLGVRFDLEVISDGSEALARLRGEGRHAGKLPPDLVFLDLGLPRLGGREVLKAMGKDARLARVPTAVFTSSGQDEDVLLAFDHRAVGFVRKPPEPSEIARVIERAQVLHGPETPGPHVPSKRWQRWEPVPL